MFNKFTNLLTITQQSEEIEKDTCPICLDDIENKGFVNLDCNHKIHLACFLVLIKTRTGKKCPLCRDTIDKSQPIQQSGRVHGYVLPPADYESTPEPTPEPMSFEESDLLIDSEDEGPIVLAQPISILRRRPHLILSQRRIVRAFRNDRLHALSVSTIEDRIYQSTNRDYRNQTISRNCRILETLNILTLTNTLLFTPVMPKTV